MKPMKRRAAVRRIGGASRTARRAREEWLAKRRAAVAAWRKLPKELERLKERIMAELEKALPRFASLTTAIDEFDSVAMLGLVETPGTMFEELQSELVGLLDTYVEREYEQEVTDTKEAPPA